MGLAYAQQYGPGFGSAALDALRRLVPGNASPAGGMAPNPLRLTESDHWGDPATEAGQGTVRGWGGQLSPPMSTAGSIREGGWGNRNPTSGIPPVEQAGDEGVLQSLRMAFPPKQFNPPSRSYTDA